MHRLRPPSACGTHSRIHASRIELGWLISLSCADSEACPCSSATVLPGREAPGYEMPPARKLPIMFRSTRHNAWPI